MQTSLLQMLNSPKQAASTSPNTSSSSTSDPTAGLDKTFLQLLSAQLKAQNPLNPLDPNQFVAQLAQFQSLSELTQIDQLMQMLVKNTTLPSSSATGANANAGASSTSKVISNAISH